MSGNIVEANPVLNGRRRRIQSPNIGDNVDEDNNMEGVSIVKSEPVIDFSKLPEPEKKTYHIEQENDKKNNWTKDILSAIPILRPTFDNKNWSSNNNCI